MPTVAIYNAAGETVGQQTLPDRFFSVAPNAILVQQAVVAEQANARVALAHTKTRSEVRGGGKKPWRQKGTGRARHGSIRSPLWRSGGVTFGPRNDANFTLKLNKKMKRLALLIALSDKVTSHRFIIFDNLAFRGKTKDWPTATSAVLQKLAPERKGKPKSLVVLPVVSDEAKRATANVTGVEAIRADSLYVRAILQHEYTITTVAGVAALEQWLAGRSGTESKE